MIGVLLALSTMVSPFPSVFHLDYHLYTVIELSRTVGIINTDSSTTKCPYSSAALVTNEIILVLETEQNNLETISV